MLNDIDLIAAAEQIYLDKNTPASTRASLFRTLAEIRGLVGKSASSNRRSADDTAGNERTAADIKAELADLRAELVHQHK